MRLTFSTAAASPKAATTCGKQSVSALPHGANRKATPTRQAASVIASALGCERLPAGQPKAKQAATVSGGEGLPAGQPKAKQAATVSGGEGLPAGQPKAKQAATVRKLENYCRRSCKRAHF